MSSIRKRGETYQAQVRLSGGRASSATFKTRAKAQVWVREQSFTLSQMPKNRDERTTLSDIIERFIRDVIPLRQSGDIEAFRLSMIGRHPIASKRLVEINNSDLCSYRDQRLRQVKREDEEEREGQAEAEADEGGTGGAHGTLEVFLQR